jgi:N-acyl-D-aspartate/D-glutamate deacylase
MRQRMETGSDFENIVLLVGFENIRATSLRQAENLPYEGQSIADIAAAQGKDPYDALFDLLASEHCAVSMIDFIASETDIDKILQAPFSGVISDATYPSGGLLHRRVYGTFPRLLETYVNQKGVLTLPEAIRKITRQPADQFGLARKGRIEVGADADLCLFRLENIHEADTWTDPAQLAQGMDYVFVNGVPAIAEGALTSAHSGKLL